MFGDREGSVTLVQWPLFSLWLYIKKKNRLESYPGARVHMKYVI